MNESNTDIATAAYFGGVIVIIVAVAIIAWRFRRRDLGRIADNNERLGMRQSDDFIDSPLMSRIVGVTADTHTIDPTTLIGAGSLKSRYSTKETHKVTRAQVNDAVVNGHGAGVAAVVRLRVTSTASRGRKSKQSVTASEDVVVVRLRRPIAGSIQVAPATRSSISPDQLGWLDDLMQQTGIPTSLIDDPDLGRHFGARSNIDQIVVHDEGLRALLWSMRLTVDEADSVSTTRRYEEMIQPKTFRHLTTVDIDGDLMILRSGASPFKVTADQRMIELAEHIAANFH